MKSIVNEPVKGLEGSVFPCLMKSRNSGAVYLFTSPSEAICLHKAQSVWGIGQKADQESLDSATFFRFEGSVTLENVNAR